jgi:hypothetical protein
LYCPEENNGANLVLDLNVQLKDAGIQKNITANRKPDLKLHEQKVKPMLTLKLKSPVGQQ